MKKKKKEQQEIYDDGSLGQVAKFTATVTFKVILAGILVVALYIGADKAYDYGYSLFNGATMEKSPGTDVIITVAEDMSHSQLAALLYKKGLVSDETAARILLKIFTADDYDILPGEYTLNTSMTMQEMINAMVGEVEEEATTSDYLGLYD